MLNLSGQKRCWVVGEIGFSCPVPFTYKSAKMHFLLEDEGKKTCFFSIKSGKPTFCQNLFFLNNLRLAQTLQIWNLSICAKFKWPNSVMSWPLIFVTSKRQPDHIWSCPNLPAVVSEGTRGGVSVAQNWAFMLRFTEWRDRENLRYLEKECWEDLRC